MKQKQSLRNSAFIICTALISGASFAETVTLPAVNSGYYNLYGQSSQSVGQQGNITLLGPTSPGGTPLYHNWLAFNLAAVTGDIIGATLEIYTSPKNTSGQSILWYDVSTPYSQMGSPEATAAGRALGKTIFNDLGSGVLLGQGTHTAGNLNSYVLNADALSSLNDADSMWMIGGGTTTPMTFVNGIYNMAFGYTLGISAGYTMQLKLDIAEPPPAARFVVTQDVPEGGWTLGMLGLGVFGLCALRPRIAAAK